MLISNKSKIFWIVSWGSNASLFNIEKDAQAFATYIKENRVPVTITYTTLGYR